MPAENSPPRFSVVIPTYRRPEQLRACLATLARVNPPPGGFEVVVVDDGSPESQQSVVADFEGKLAVTFLRQENAGPATARNLGASQARGQYLVFLDDDCRVDVDWLVEFDAAFARYPDALIGGRTENRLVGNRYAEASQLILDLVYEHYNSHAGQVTFLTSNNFALPVDRFRALGGFSAEHFRTAGGEDRDLCDRWVNQFGTMRQTGKALVGHYHEMTLGGFWRQNFNYGRGAWAFHRIRAANGTPRLRRDARFHLRIPGLLWRRLSGERRTSIFTMLPLLAVWQVANACGFVREGWRSRQASRNKPPPSAERLASSLNPRQARRIL